MKSNFMTEKLSAARRQAMIKLVLYVDIKLSLLKACSCFILRRFEKC